MRGGLSIRFYGSACRRAGLGDDYLTRPETELAAKILALLQHDDVRPVGHTPFFHDFHDHVDLVSRVVHLVALEHLDCEECYVTDLTEEEHVSDEAWYRDLAEELGARAELLMDFLCAYLQRHDTRNFARVFRLPDGDPRSDNARRKRVAVERLNEVLGPHGYVVLPDGEVLPSEIAGTRPTVERPAFAALDAAGWRDAGDRLADAEAELTAGKPADALTDASTALQFALKEAGYPGNALGDQLKAARKGGLFDGVDRHLGDALDSTATWISGMRNTRSDAHANPPPSDAEALLALRLVAVFAAWLADRHRLAQP